MSTKISDYIIKTQPGQWELLKEEGIDTRGIYFLKLRCDEKGRPVSFLLKFEPHASYPYHNHPAGEELLVLEGSCKVEGTILSQGDFLYTPPNFKHSVSTETGCIIHFIVPEEVEIIG